MSWVTLVDHDTVADPWQLQLHFSVLKSRHVFPVWGISTALHCSLRVFPHPLMMQHPGERKVRGIPSLRCRQEFISLLRERRAAGVRFGVKPDGPHALAVGRELCPRRSTGYRSLFRGYSRQLGVHDAVGAHSGELMSTC